jgi:hypothetical protein
VLKTFPKKGFGDFSRKKKRTSQMNEPFTFCMLAKFGTKPKQKRFEKQTHQNKEKQVWRTFDQNHMR